MLIIPPPLDHCVYLLARRDHVVIYVGVTSNLFARLGSHAEHKSWWPEVASVQVECFETRKVADIREAHLIQTLEPFYNVAGSETGLTRHLDELRLATLAIRRARRQAVIKPQALEIALVPTCEIKPPAPGGVTLTEALPYLTAYGPLTIAGLRTAAGRRGFPPPVGRAGDGATAAKVYDLDMLLAWRRGDLT